MQQELGLLLSHESVEWYTPKKYTDLVKEVMGAIDLDPASNDTAQSWIQADKYYTVLDDGLTKEWWGRVFINPPYSKTAGRSNQEIWAEKLVNEYRAGNVTEAIMLVKSALGYKWFQELWNTVNGVCFANELICFVDSSGNSSKPAKLGSTFFYWGSNYIRFAHVFSRIGRVYPNVPDIDNRQGRLF